MSDEPKGIDTAAPQVNFTITTTERVKALAAGPPAYSVRLREIEDLEASLVKTFRDLEAKRGARLDLAVDAVSTSVENRFRRLQKLVSSHNRYYPIEANLPIDPDTGALVDFNRELWKPRPEPSLHELLTRSRG